MQKKKSKNRLKVYAQRDIFINFYEKRMAFIRVNLLWS